MFQIVLVGCLLAGEDWKWKKCWFQTFKIGLQWTRCTKRFVAVPTSTNISVGLVNWFSERRCLLVDLVIFKSFSLNNVISHSTCGWIYTVYTEIYRDSSDSSASWQASSCLHCFTTLHKQKCDFTPSAPVLLYVHIWLQVRGAAAGWAEPPAPTCSRLLCQRVTGIHFLLSSGAWPASHTQNAHIHLSSVRFISSRLSSCCKNTML